MCTKRHKHFTMSSLSTTNIKVRWYVHVPHGTTVLTIPCFLRHTKLVTPMHYIKSFRVPDQHHGIFKNNYAMVSLCKGQHHVVHSKHHTWNWAVPFLVQVVKCDQRRLVDRKACLVLLCTTRVHALHS